jgi:hypothetical protein
MSLATFQLPDIDRVFIERQNDSASACDVLVRMTDGTIYTCLFVTLAHLRRQMEMNRMMLRQVECTVPARFAALDTPHMLVEALDKDSIEDAIDNLLALDMFETMFTRVTELQTEAVADAKQRRTQRDTTRTTQEVAAVVLSDVLVVTG